MAVLSSSHILSLIEEKYSIAWIAFPFDGGEWTGSRSLDYFIGYDSGNGPLRPRFLASVHPDDRPELLLDLSFLTKRTLPCRRTVRLQVAGRTERHVQIEFRHVEGPDFDGLNLLLLKDVSEEIYNIQRLEQFEKQREQAMRSWKMKGLWWADCEYNLIDYTGRDELVFDRSLLGRRYMEIVPPEHRDALSAKLLDIGQQARPFDVPVYVMGSDGVTRSYHLRGAPYYEKETISGWCGYISYAPVTIMPNLSGRTDGALISQLSAPLLRAGCAALGWNYAELATRARLSTSTVNRILTSSGPLTETFRSSSLLAIVEAMEAANLTYRREACGGISLCVG